MMNEEEIKANILLPFLRDLGFDVREISFEKSFSIRLGKSVKQIRGRLDILCKRNGKNLFIVELKAESVSITQEDIAQGVSYARVLTDGIAPFTIITNGSTTKIFDSVSGQELTGKIISETSSFWKNGYTLSTDEELKIRFEALKNFVSLSPANLKEFCAEQVLSRMGYIIGDSSQNSTAKFIKGLYFQRENLKSSFNNFINSDAKVFGIVGLAGVGKTNVMCSLALRHLDDQFVFFYNAALITQTPLEYISQDLNLTFSSKSEPDLVLKKLDELGRFSNTVVLIFIDAIDESSDAKIALELSEIALAVRSLEKVKLCISCKSSMWKNVLKRNDTHTHLFEELDKSHDLVPSLDNFPGFLLEEFTDAELESIIPLYRSVYGFEGQISVPLLKELRNGFFLRIFSEVYSHKEVPLQIDDKNLIRKYLNQSLEKTNLGIVNGLLILSRLGEVLLNHTYSELGWYSDEGMEIGDLLGKLNFSKEGDLSIDLFLRNILIKSTNDDTYNVAFYYSKIRDYIICFHSLKLDKLNDDAFYKILELLFQNHIGQSALAFYIENSNASHHAVISKFKKDKAHSYVDGYNSFLNTHFKNFKNQFNPHTSDDIGIILPNDLVRGDGYALFPLKMDSVKRMRFENLNNLLNRDVSDLIQIGAKTFHGSNHHLMSPHQNDRIRDDIFKQLKKIIENGRLDEHVSEILNKEKISTIIYFYQKELGYNLTIKDYNLPRFEIIYPIHLADVIDRIYRYIANRHYRYQNPLPPSIDSLIEEVVQKKMYLPEFEIKGDFPPFEELLKLVKTLIEKDVKVIETHHFPFPDRSISEAKEAQSKNGLMDKIHWGRTFQYSPEQARLYIEAFFLHVEQTYREVVEYCLPTFKEEFVFLNDTPHEYILYMKDMDVLKWGYIGWRPSRNRRVTISIKDINAHEEAFKVDEMTQLQTFTLNSILHNDFDVRYNMQTIDGIKTPKVDQFCVIRNWVYQLLRADAEILFKE